MFTNLVQSDAAVQGALGKSASLVNGSQAPGAFAAVLDITQGSAPAAATKPGTILGSGGGPPNSADKKRTQNTEPALAAAVPLVIPQVSVDAQPAALPNSSETVAPPPEGNPKADARAGTPLPQTLAPQSNALPSRPLNPLGSFAGCGVAAPIQAAPSPKETKTSGRTDGLPAPFIDVANDASATTTWLPGPMALGGPALSATPSQASADLYAVPFAPPQANPAGSSTSPIVPPTKALPADSVEPGEVNTSGAAGSTIPAGSNSDLAPLLNPSLAESNEPDLLPPSFEMARALASGKVVSPSSPTTPAPSKSGSTDPTAGKRVSHYSKDGPLAAVPPQPSSLGSGNSITGNPTRSAIALPEFSPPNWMRPTAQGQPSLSGAVGNDPAKNPPGPALPAGHEHPAPEMTNPPAAAIVTTIPSSAAMAAITPDLSRPEVPAQASGNVAADPQASVSVLAAQPAGNQTPASRTPEPTLDPAARVPQPPESSGVAVVQTARMIEGVGQSEMHIGLRTQAFGSVEVHTALRETQLGLSVSSERGDLRSFLQADGPTLQTVLQQHDLRFGSIRFLQTETGHNSGASSNPDSQRHSFTPGGTSPTPLPLANATEEKESGEISLQATRLSVHA